MKVSQERQWHLSRRGYLQGYCAKSAHVFHYPNARNRLLNPRSWPKHFDIQSQQYIPVGSCGCLRLSNFGMQ